MLFNQEKIYKTIFSNITSKGIVKRKILEDNETFSSQQRLVR